MGIGLEYKSPKSKEYKNKEKNNNYPKYPTPADTKKASFPHIPASLLNILYCSLCNFPKTDCLFT